MPTSCLTERQDQRHRLGAVLFQGRKDRAQRPASLDFGCPGGVARSSMHSPGFPVAGVGPMNKGLGVSSYSSYGRPDVLSSPGTPSYNRRGMTGVGYQQGLNSERVIPPSAGHRRHPGSGMVLPYSSGRTLPSKWEDAERWIISPHPNNALGRSVPQLWRPKSKSGPLGPTGRFGGAYSCVSSSAQFLDNGRVGNLTVNAPYLAGILLPEHVCGGVTDWERDLSGASGEDSSNSRGGRYAQMNGRHPAMQSTRVSEQLGSVVESYQSLPTSLESIQGKCPYVLEHCVMCIFSLYVLFSTRFLLRDVDNKLLWLTINIVEFPIELEGLDELNVAGHLVSIFSK